eukprot:1195633-Prorocentrum_minimum.AAC.7
MVHGPSGEVNGSGQRCRQRLDKEKPSARRRDIPPPLARLALVGGILARLALVGGILCEIDAGAWIRPERCAANTIVRADRKRATTGTTTSTLHTRRAGEGALSSCTFQSAIV